MRIGVGLVGRAGHGPTNQAVPVASLAEYEQIFGGPQAGHELHELHLGASLFFANGGRLASVVRLGAQSLPAVRQGLAALDAVQDLGLLCLPGLSGAATVAAAARYARSRRAFYVAEAASSRAATLSAVRQIATADRGHVAVYLPRVDLRDPLNPSAIVRFGPSAAIAGLLARIDGQRGYWGFPAGDRVQDIIGLASTIDSRAAALLRRSGVNALRLITPYGFVPWGARTVGSGRESGEDWKYVPVRRLALYLEQSIERSLVLFPYEPNDEPAWRRIRRVVGAFLDETHRMGAFAGQAAEEAFSVRCGSDTTTQRDIENGVVNIEVGFAPLRPSEFVEFRLRHRWS